MFLFSVKTHMPIFPYSFGKMNFVWRQLRLAFFGALTSVGALFIFGKFCNLYHTHKIKIKEKNNEKILDAFAIMYFNNH